MIKKSLYKENSLQYSESGNNVASEFREIVKKFYEKHRLNNINPIELRELMHNTICYTTMQEIIEDYDKQTI